MIEWLNSEVGSATVGDALRNASLTAAALVGITAGLFFAGYRSWVSGRHLRHAERSQRDDKYQRGAEMLGSSTLSTRLGGIYALERLARKYPNEFHIQVMHLLCMFSRFRESEPFEQEKVNQNSNIFDITSYTSNDTDEHEDTADSSDANLKYVFPDVEAAIRVIGHRDESQILIESNEREFKIDLRGACLKNASLWNCDLRNTMLWWVDFSNATLWNVKFGKADLPRTNFCNALLHNPCFVDSKAYHACFAGAILTHANFTNAVLYDSDFENADVSSANFTNASIGNVNFKNVRGLTQQMLDSAKPSLAPIPLLHGCVCAETGKPLVWKHLMNNL